MACSSASDSLIDAISDFGTFYDHPILISILTSAKKKIWKGFARFLHTDCCTD